MISAISLTPDNGDQVVLKLNTGKKPYAVEDILSVNRKVMEDQNYTIFLETDENIANVYVYVNGEKAESAYMGGSIYFTGDSVQLFSGIIGFAQLSLLIIYKDGKEEWLYSDFVSVLIRSTNTNKTIDSMLKYVYENQGSILRGDAKVTDIGRQTNEQFGDFWSQIILLEEIANVYESSYGYFMANCRYKLEKVEVLDRAEKLQFVDAKTIQYITQHPEYLRREVTGIKHGRQTFLPSKTLMMQNRITNDIYENQVVFSFLETVLADIASLAGRIREYIDLIRYDDQTENGYIVSAYLLYVNAKQVLEEFLTRIDGLENQFKKMVTLYSRILDVKRVSLINRPQPTPIFLNVPQYNRIYTCILRWFSRKGYDLANEKVMLNFFDAPSIYEAYTLIKLINQIKDMGYEMVESKKVNYPKRFNWSYDSKECNNTYVFRNDNSTITLYYEPFIYNEDKTDVNKIALYRNNSVSLSRETDEERQGEYYVPDYVIKYSEDNRESYIICDAKFSGQNKVQRKLMPDLIYKYLTSISTTGKNAQIMGLYVFYGLDQDNSNMESFYDKQLSKENAIEPRIEMIPLSENVAYSDQTRNAIKMFQSITSARG